MPLLLLPLLCRCGTKMEIHKVLQRDHRKLLDTYRDKGGTGTERWKVAVGVSGARCGGGGGD